MRNATLSGLLFLLVVAIANGVFFVSRMSGLDQYSMGAMWTALMAFLGWMIFKTWRTK